MKNLTAAFNGRLRAVNFKKLIPTCRLHFGLLDGCHKHLSHTRQRVPTRLQAAVAFGAKQVQNQGQYSRAQGHQKPYSPVAGILKVDKNSVGEEGAEV